MKASDITFSVADSIHPVTALLAECGAKNIIDKGSSISFSSPFREDRNNSGVLYKDNFTCVDFGGSVSGHFSYFFFKCTGKSLAQYLDLNMKSRMDFQYKATVRDRSSFSVDEVKEMRIREGEIRFDFSRNDRARAYVERRFLTDEFMEAFGVGYCTHLTACRATKSAFLDKDLKFTQFNNRICIPIFEDGEMISLEGRDFTGNHKPKVLYPKGGVTSVLFNYEYLDKTKPLIVVEGIMDMPRIWSNISQNVTTTFGVNVSQEQKRQLNEFEKVIIFSDSDDAGREMIDNCDTFLFRPFWIARLKEGDPGDPNVSIEELEETIASAKESTEFFLDESELFDEPTNLDTSFFQNS